MIWLEDGIKRVEDSYFWLSGLSDTRLTPEENHLIHSILSILSIF